MKLKQALVLSLIGLAGTACGPHDVGDPDPDGTEATVRYLNVEGGCWVLVTPSGKTFEPTVIPAGYQQDGLEVRFAYQVRNDAGSFCMVGGEIVEITAISTR